MAKRKQSKSKGYISKGQRPNVSKQTTKALRRDRKDNPAVEDVLKSYSHRKRVIYKPQNDAERKLAKKYATEDAVFAKSNELLLRYSKSGLTKAETVMAVKTDRVSELINKWKPRMSAWVKEQKAKQKKMDLRKFSGGLLLTGR